MLYNSILELAGNTPLLRLSNICKNSNLYVKLEFLNPTNSIKIRPAVEIIKHAEENGLLDKDTVIIESSSGNFGVALAFLGTLKKYKVVIVIDPRTSETHKKLLAAYGAEIVCVSDTDLKNGSYQKARIKKVEELSKKYKQVFIPNQYANPNNLKAHYDHTAEEIIKDMDQIDYVVVAVSTGGTISGLGRKLKKETNAKIIAVDADGSTIFGGKAKNRFMSGMGANIKPKNVDLSIIDRVIKVDDIDSFKMCHRLVEEEGLLLGGSSGAAISAAIKLSKGEAKGKNIVVISADSGINYLDTIYSEAWFDEVKKLGKYYD
jgi:2,3-diaminopropionate biosynthesis protein SbnA